MPRRLLLVLAFLMVEVFSAMAGDAGNGPLSIFEKVLSDGSTASIEKISRQIHQDAPPKSPDGMIWVGGDCRVDEYRLRMKDTKGAEQTVWTKEIFIPIATSKFGPSQELIIHDVAADLKRIAVLYSSESNAAAEIVAPDKNGRYSTLSKITLFSGTWFGRLSSGQLVWAKDLFVFTETDVAGTEIWRLSNNKAERVYTVPKNNGRDIPSSGSSGDTIHNCN